MVPTEKLYVEFQKEERERCLLLHENCVDTNEKCIKIWFLKILRWILWQAREIGDTKLQMTDMGWWE